MADTSDEDEVAALVFDNGSSTLKAGFAGDDAPTTQFSCVVGRTHSPNTSLKSEEFYVGNAAQMKRELLSLKYPLNHGIVTNWDAMEKVWHHAFSNELRVSPGNHCILLTEPVLNPKVNRETMAQVMFETFNSPGIDVALQPVLAIVASCRGCCVNLDLGDGVCSVLPYIFPSYCPSSAIMRSDLAGRDLTDYLMKSLSRQDYSFSTTADHEIVRGIKEKYCYVALDWEQENRNSADSSNIEKLFHLPDGQVINIKNERFTCPEILFQPSLFGRKGSGVHKMIYNSLMNCDNDIRCDLYTNIFITGGTTMFPGFIDRLQKEMTQLLPSNRTVKVIGATDREYSVWTGGSILASLSTTTWFTKPTYFEYGPSVLQKSSLKTKL